MAVLSTERLILRPRSDSDLPLCYAMNCEPGTLDFIDFPREGSWTNESDHKAFITETHTHEFPPGMGYYAITTRDAPGGFMGWVLLAPEDLYGSEIEVGWRLSHAARQQGYATEAARALVDHGFEELGISMIIADMYRANNASYRVAEKLGMRHRPDPVNTTEKYVRWEMTRGMWTAARRRRQ